MRCEIKNGILLFFVCAIALGCSVSPGMAEEARPPAETAGGTGETAANMVKDEPQVVFETEGNFFLGYRWLNTEDSLKASEYLYPHSSVTFGLNLLSCPLPYRYHVHSEFLSKHDLYSDAGFAYKDLILFRDILVGVRHNLDLYNYDYAGDPPVITYSDRNTVKDPYVNYLSNLATLRLKAPDFPFHAFINHRYVDRDGKIQQRFLQGYFNELNMVSETRDIDWTSKALKLGTNSHLGPVELEYAYDTSKFDPGSNNILYDDYPAADNFGRAADSYPHHVVAETESSSHSIRMHSSYTGSIVAAATVSNLHQENNYSDTESTTWKGAFDFSWIPAPVIGLFFKYRHRDVDMDTPDTVTLNGLHTAVNYPVRNGISYDKDVFSLSSRYKPLQRLSLFAGYEFSLLDRKNLDDWELLPSRTKIHTVDLRAHAKPLNNVAVKAIYEYKNYDQPAYNTTPDSSNKLRLTTNYTPSPAINVYLEYSLFISERDSLHYLNNDPAALLKTGDRDGKRDQFVASLTTEISPKASLTFSWFYERWRVEQDLAYGKWLSEDAGDLPYIDDDVPHTDKANSFSLAFHWMPRDDFTVGGNVTYTIAEGKVHYSDVFEDAPFSLSSFSKMKASETTFSLDLAKKLSPVWEIGLNSYLHIYNDKKTGLLDGNVFTGTFALKRYF